MRDSIKTRHMITSAIWNEGKGIWELKVQNLETGEEFEDFANFLLDGTGIFKVSRLVPAVPPPPPPPPPPVSLCRQELILDE